jgi:hypothetical protein
MLSYLQLVSQQPFIALSLTDIKTHLNLIDDSTDAYVAGLLDAAVLYVEKRMQLDLRSTNWRLMCDSFPWPPSYTWRAYGYYPFFIPNFPQYAIGREIQFYQRINLKRGPVQAVQQIQYYDANNVLNVVDPATYVVMQPSYQPGIIEPISYFPVAYPRADALQITFTSGLQAVPPSVLHAVRLLVGTWFSAREDMAYGASTVGNYSEQAVECLLSQFSIPSVA